MPTKAYYQNRELDLKQKELDEKKAGRLQEKDLRDKERKAGYIKSLLSIPKLKLNDFSWYNKVKELFNSNSNIPQYYPNGSPILPGDFNTSDDVDGVLPHALVVLWDNTWSNNAKENEGENHAVSSINIAMDRYYTNLRKENSRIGEYMPSDLGQVTFAMTELLTFICDIKRALQAANTFDENNPFMAQMIIKELGYDYEDFRKNKKDIIKWLNEKIDEFNTFATLPSDMSYVSRKVLLNSVVYKEGTGKNAQLIIPVQAQRYVYSETDACLRPVRNQSSEQATAYYKAKFDDIVKHYDKMLNGILNSTVLTTMIADIRASKLNFIKIPYITSEEKLDLRPVDEVLHQIMNASVFPGFEAQVSLDPNTGAYSKLRPYIREKYNAMEALFETGSYNPFTYIFNGTHMLKEDTSGFLYESTENVRGYGYKLGDSSTFFTRDGVQNIQKFVATDKSGVLLNYYSKESVKPEELVESTRLTTLFEALPEEPSLQENSVTFRISCSMSEVVLGIGVAKINLANTVPMWGTTFISGGIYAIQEAYNTTNTKNMWDLVAFNYVPRLPVFTEYNRTHVGNKYNDVPLAWNTLQQIDCCFPITKSNLKSLHVTCWKSLLTIGSNWDF